MVCRCDDCDDSHFALFVTNVINNYYTAHDHGGASGVKVKKFWFSHNKKERTLIFLWSYRGTKIHSQTVDYDDLETLMMQISMQRVG